MSEMILSYIISAILSVSVPVSILFGRSAIKNQRQATLGTLRETLKRKTGRDAALIPSFEFALQKYDMDEPGAGRATWRENLFYMGTALIFVLISWAGVVLLVEQARPGDAGAVRFVLAGLRAASDEFTNAATSNDPNAYAALTGYEMMTVAVIAFAFLGAYLWSIQYLIRRVANFDLSPMSFLRATAQIIFACAVAAVFRHFVTGAGDAGSFTDGLILLTAFLIGFFPNAGFDYLTWKVPQLRVKRIDPDAPAAFRAIPVDIIDGIDAVASFRLAEREIVDVQNLATENPVLLCAETPYPLLAVIDWIAQAQLALEVGPKAYKRLRDIGLRTIFALERARGDPKLEPATLAILYEAEAERPQTLAVRLDGMKSNLHVLRLYQVWEAVREAFEDGGGAAGGGDATAGGAARGTDTGEAVRQEQHPAEVITFDRGAGSASPSTSLSSASEST
jgi:hypothetical protein